MNTRAHTLFAVLVLVFATLCGRAAGAAAPGTPLTREQFTGALTREIATHFNLEGELVLDLLRPWTPPRQTASDWQVSIVEFPNVATSSLVVRSRITADGALVAEESIVLRASLWRQAWVTRETLTANATFDPAVLDTRRVDLLRERDALPATVGDRTYIFARGVAAGRLLTWRDIARRPLVRKGEIVQVSAIDGPLVVTLKGLAMENGAQGEIVTIRNPDSRRDFTALVIDENRVQVRF